MSCDDLISAQPRMHHSSALLLLALLQRLKANSGGLPIKGFVHCMKSIKHRKCALNHKRKDEHFTAVEVAHSTWHNQCVVIGLSLVKCFYAAVSSGLQFDVRKQREVTLYKKSSLVIHAKQQCMISISIHINI